MPRWNEISRSFRASQGRVSETEVPRAKVGAEAVNSHPAMRAPPRSDCTVEREDRLEGLQLYVRGTACVNRNFPTGVTRASMHGRTRCKTACSTPPTVGEFTQTLTPPANYSGAGIVEGNTSQGKRPRIAENHEGTKEQLVLSGKLWSGNSGELGDASIACPAGPSGSACSRR